jgi:hypothetical protein
VLMLQAEYLLCIFNYRIEIFNNPLVYIKVRCRGSSVGIETGYRVTGRIRFPAEVRFFSSLQRPNRLWGPPNL